MRGQLRYSNICDIVIDMQPVLSTESVNAEVDDLLLSGRAKTASQAEEMFLDAHLAGIAQLVLQLDDSSFQRHEAIKLLMSHGSRRLEDALP